MRRYIAWRSAAGLLVVLVMAAGGAAANPAAAVVARPTSASELHGHEQFRLTTSSATSGRQRLHATGVLNARGHAFAGRLIAGRVRNWLVVPHGAIRLNTVVARSKVTPPNARCEFTQTYAGAYRIRGGARRYASASGSGTYVTRIIGRLVRKDGKCTSAIAYFRQSTVTSGSLRW